MKNETVEKDLDLNQKTYPSYLPNVDAYGTKDSIVLSIELPGIDKNNININLEDRILTVEGKRTLDSIQNEKLKKTHLEYSVGEFKRQFAIKEEIDQESISATFVNGVLKLKIPKKVTEAKKIQIN